jgi:hypothetical protein
MMRRDSALMVLVSSVLAVPGRAGDDAAVAEPRPDAPAGPVVPTFNKDARPRREAAQPFFNELHAAYPKASIRGVMNVHAEAATLRAGLVIESSPVRLRFPSGTRLRADRLLS